MRSEAQPGEWFKRRSEGGAALGATEHTHQTLERGLMSAVASWSAVALHRFSNVRISHAPAESARGLAQSKTLARIRGSPDWKPPP